MLTDDPSSAEMRGLVRLLKTVAVDLFEDEIAARAKRTVRLFDGNVAEDVRSRPLLEASA